MNATTKNEVTIKYSQTALRAIIRNKGRSLRDGKRPSSGGARYEAQVALDAFRAFRAEPTIVPLRDWPATSTIEEYRAALDALRLARKAYRRERAILAGASRYYRYEVCRYGDAGGMGLCFIDGHGDTIEEAARAAKIID